MTEQTAEKQQYMISVSEPDEAGGDLIFTVIPEGVQRPGSAGFPKRVPQFVVTVHQGDPEPSFAWSGTPDDPGPYREEIRGGDRRADEGPVNLDRTRHRVGRPRGAVGKGIGLVHSSHREEAR